MTPLNYMRVSFLPSSSASQMSHSPNSLLTPFPTTPLSFADMTGRLNQLLTHGSGVALITDDTHHDDVGGVSFQDLLAKGKEISRISSLIRTIKNDVWQAKAWTILALALGDGGMEAAGRTVIHEAWRNELQPWKAASSAEMRELLSDQEIVFLKKWAEDEIDPSEMAQALKHPSPLDKSAEHMCSVMPDFAVALGKLGLQKEVDRALFMAKSGLKNLKKGPTEQVFRATIALAEAKLGRATQARETLGSETSSTSDAYQLRAKIAFFLQDKDDLEGIWNHAQAVADVSFEGIGYLRVKASVIKRMSELAALWGDRELLKKGLALLDNVRSRQAHAKAAMSLVAAMKKLKMEEEAAHLMRRVEETNRLDDIQSKVNEDKFLTAVLGDPRKVYSLPIQAMIAEGKARLGLEEQTERLVEASLKQIHPFFFDDVIKSIVTAAVALKRSDWLDHAWKISRMKRLKKSLVDPHRAQIIILKGMIEVAFLSS